MPGDKACSHGRQGILSYYWYQGELESIYNFCWGDEAFKERAVPAWEVGFGLCYTMRSAWWHGPHFPNVDLTGRWVTMGQP